MEKSKLKHIDIVQSTITRLAKNSFLIKGWTITLLTGLLVFLSKHGITDKFVYYIIFLLPIGIFWILDSYYLWQERLFRGLYDRITDDLNGESDLKMKIPIDIKDKIRFRSALFSISEIIYLLLAVVSVIIVIAW